MRAERAVCQAWSELPVSSSQLPDGNSHYSSLSQVPVHKGEAVHSPGEEGSSC